MMSRRAVSDRVSGKGIERARHKGNPCTNVAQTEESKHQRGGSKKDNQIDDNPKCAGGLGI